MAPTANVKRCHYEVLGISQQFDDAELKKAYRTAAMQHHPDKNRGREAEAAEEFKIVQEAYDVLSDPHERAWYDSHRTQILRGQTPGDMAEEGSGAATEVELFNFFSNSCFESFDDEEDGFYTVYRMLFVALGSEEAQAGAKSEFCEFGRSDSVWAVVRDFYERWTNFTSVKTFSFADKYNLTECSNREERRFAEKENKKCRNKARREYNALVRELVLFVRKRDPRVKRHAQEEKRLKAEKEARRAAKQQEEAAARKERNKEAKAAREQAMEEDAAGLDEILASIALDDAKAKRKAKKKVKVNVDDDEDEGNDEQCEAIESEDEEVSEEEEEGEAVELYCVVCKKKFRSAAQAQNHYSSKKCKQAWAKLRRQLEKEQRQMEKEDDIFYDARSS